MISKEVYAVWGAGRKSMHIASILSAYSSKRVVNYFVESKQLWKCGSTMRFPGGGCELEANVIALEELKVLYEKKEISGILYPTTYHLNDWKDIQRQCLNIGIPADHIFAVPLDIMQSAQPLQESDYQRMFTPYQELRQLYHVKVHVTDNCNMKCKGCSHFCTLVDDNKSTATSASRIIENFARLKEMIPDINDIAILGGEPLLHPDLSTIIDGISQLFPYPHRTNLSIITNGILLTTMSPQLVESIHRNQVRIGYSLYSGLYKIVKKNVEFLKKNNISYSFGNVDEKFQRLLSKQACFIGKKVNRKCGHCVCMKDNLISKCPLLASVYYFNERFGNTYPDNGKVDIYKVNSAKELIGKINDGGGLCDYCSGGEVCYVDWEKTTRNSALPSDWQIDFMRS